MSFIAFYPLLLVLIYITSIYAQNLTEISEKDYFKTLFFMELFFTASLAFIFLLTSNIHLSALITTFLFFVMTNINTIFVALYSKYQRSLMKNKITYLALTFSITVTISLLLAFILRKVDLSFISKIGFYTLAFLNLIIIQDTIKRHKTFNTHLKTDDIKNKKNIIINNDDTPDIYHIILDAHSGFSRKDLCDLEFKENLINLGFNIYENFYSNYMTTNLSVSSFLNYDYVYNLIKEKTNIILPEMILPFYKNNRVFEFFMQNGYDVKTVIKSKYFNFLFKNTSNFTTRNQFFELLFYCFVKYSNNFTSQIKNTLEHYSKLPIDIKKKNFHYIHLLAPHPPYYCNEKGNLNSENNFTNPAYYLPYQKYINKLTINNLKQIMEKMKKNSIIILHSDHGFVRTKEFAHNILLAIYTPDKQKLEYNQDETSLVNLYRLIFNKYFNKNLPLLKSEFYINNNTDFIVSKYEKDIKEEQC